MFKKINIVLVLLLLIFVSLSAVSAVDDTNSTISSSDEAIVGVYSSQGSALSEDALSISSDDAISATVHKINAKNYNTYFNYKTGELVSKDVKAGDTIELDGTFTGSATDAVNFVFNIPVNIVGTSSNQLNNGVVTLKSGASGSNVSGLKILNTVSYNYGVFLNGATNCTVSNCFVNNTGASSYAICIGNNANYNNIINNNFNCYGITYGHGTRSTSPVLVSGSHYNYIANNIISCDDANAIYLSSFDGGPLNGGVSNFNTIYNNTVKYNVLPTSWSYGIQIMGGNNIIDSNRVTGAYRGISAQGSGNVITNNRIINLTGADYANLGVEVGGDVAIVGSYYSVIANNSIENAKIASNGAGISVLDNSIVENNNVEVKLVGYGIHPQGSNITIIGNNISTASGAGIIYDTYSFNLTVTRNNITSQSGVGVLIKKVSNKKMPGDIVITYNYISTNNAYAIDAKEADASKYYNINYNTVPKGKGSILTPAGEFDPSKPIYNFNGVKYTVTPSNYATFIDENGNINSTVKDGDILYFDGVFSNKIIVKINSAIKITGNNPTFYNTTFRVLSDGVWIENLIIKNIKSSTLNAWGVLAYDVYGATITNCDIEVEDPNAAYAIYVVESSNVDVLNNKLRSSGDYLTYTILAHTVEDCNFINNTIFTVGTGQVHQFEAERCVDGSESCLDGDTVCTDGDTVCTDGDTVCTDGDTVCTDGDTVCTDGDTVCTDGDTVCTDGDTSCLDGDTVCTSGNTVKGNHVLNEVYRTYGILMVYSSNNNVTGNKVTVTSKLNRTYGPTESTNSVVGIDLYYNSHNNIFSDNEVYVKANDNYIYGMGVLGYYTGHNAPIGQGATNNQFINNNIVLEGTYCVEGIIIGDESENTVVKSNFVNIESGNVVYGINLEMSQKSIIEENTLILNSDIVYGIEAVSSSENIINNNEFTVDGKQGYGFLLSNSENNIITGNKLINNVNGEDISFRNYDALGYGVAGVYLKSNSSVNSLKNNNITSKKGYAIILDDIAVGNVIVNNYLVSEKGIGNKAVNSTANNVVEDNYKYVLSASMDGSIVVRYLETGNLIVNVDTDGALVKFYVLGEEIGQAISKNDVASLKYAFDESYTPADYGLTAVVSKEDYASKELTSTLSIEKGILEIGLKDIQGYELNTVDFTATVKNALGNGVANVLVKFYRIQNGRSVFIGDAKTDKDGVATKSIELASGLAGNYKYSAKIDESENYLAAEAEANLVISKRTDTSLQIKTTVYPKGVVAVLKDAKGNVLKNKKVSVTVGTTTTSVTTGSDGSIVMPSTVRGTYQVTVSFNGDSNYNPIVSTAKVTVKPAIVGTIKTSTYYGNTITYKVRIYGSDGKVVGKNKQVTLKVGSTSYTLKTDKNGYVSKALKLKAGTYTVTASFNGDKVSNKITFKPTLTAKDVSAKKAKTTKFSVKLVDKNGKILKSKSITFKLKGKTYTAKTNNKGTATLTLKNLAVGTYTITSSYGGCTISNKITIKK